LPVWSFTEAAWPPVDDHALPAQALAWGQAHGFSGQSGRVLAVPDSQGGIAGLLLGLGDGRDGFVYGRLAQEAPSGSYHLETGLDADLANQAALSFGLSAYAFNRYKSDAKPQAVFLAPPAHADMTHVRRVIDAVSLTRDLVNTPAEHMGPEELAAAALAVAERYGAKTKVIIGDDLLTQNYPLIHAVGRASTRAPRLVDLTWTSKRAKGDAPLISLVGKGVCFDTGGLDIKPSSGMAMMKKDMGGAANILGLAQMVMDADLPIRLRVLLPIVENNISGNAFRTSDIFTSRKGISVEIGNTDAEGRLILADALAEADNDGPDLLIDLATLTGAARVALGPDLPPFYTDDEALAGEVAEAAVSAKDPLWRMPLWAPYAKTLNSRIADLKSTSDGGFAGSVTAAMFLKRFVDKAKSWLHADIYAWNPETLPARPQGGEAQAIRALFAVLTQRYGG
jgi:leucyl aminopeptidase